MDRETQLVNLRLELSNLRRGETENTAEFIARADILSKELAGSQVDVGIAITRAIRDQAYKERLLFEYAKTRNFEFNNVKALLKAMHFSLGKDNPFDPGYKDSKGISLLSPLQSTDELMRQCMINTSAAFPALVQGVRTLSAALLNSSSSSFSSGNTLTSYATNPATANNQRIYRGQNTNDDRFYICNEVGHYANQCRQAPNRPSNQQQSSLSALQRHPQEVRTILALPTPSHLDAQSDYSESRMLIEFDQNIIASLLLAPAVTKNGGVRKTRTGKNKVRIDRERLRTMLDDEEADTGELMDTIEEIYDPRIRAVREERQPQHNDNNLRIPQTRVTKTGRVQELVIRKIPKTSDPV